VSKVTNFYAMFEGASSFNTDISKWDVLSGTDFRYMFSGANTFNQDLSSWPPKAQETYDFCPSAANCHMPDKIKPMEAILIGAVFLFVIMVVVGWRHHKYLSNQHERDNNNFHATMELVEGTQQRCTTPSDRDEHNDDNGASSLIDYAPTLSLHGNKYQSQQNDDTFENGVDLCIICEDKKKDVVLIPCRHLCVCLNCFEIGKLVKCPICREVVKDSMKIYQ